MVAGGVGRCYGQSKRTGFWKASRLLLRTLLPSRLPRRLTGARGSLGIELEGAARRRGRRAVVPARVSAHRPPVGRRRRPTARWEFSRGWGGLAAVAYVVVQLVRAVLWAVVPVPPSGALRGPRPALAWPGRGEAARGRRGRGGSDRGSRVWRADPDRQCRQVEERVSLRAP